jgi:hypothetical protein
MIDWRNLDNGMEESGSVSFGDGMHLMRFSAATRGSLLRAVQLIEKGQGKTFPRLEVVNARQLL